MNSKAKRTHTCRTDEIERLRNARGLSAERLAALAGIHLRTLRRIMKGRPAYLENISAIADVLKVPCDTLLATYKVPGYSPVSLQVNTFTLNIALTGTVDSQSQFATLATLTPDVISKLAALGIEVHSYDAQFTVSEKAGDAHQRVIVLIYGKLESGMSFWCFAAIKPSRYDAYYNAYATKTLNLYKDFEKSNEAAFGEIVVSGEGERPTREIVAQVAEWYQGNVEVVMRNLKLE